MNNPRNLFREFNDEKLEQVRTHPYFSKIREYILTQADEMIVTDPPRIKYSDLHAYVTTGSRDPYNIAFEPYRARMNMLFQAYLVTGDEKYLPELADTIWNICDMESWCPPAHIQEWSGVAARRKHLELSSTSIGKTLAEIVYYIGDKLPELVTRRTIAEIRYRVIDSFANGTPGFCNVKHNWASVCVANVLCTYLYLATEEEIEAQMPRFMKTIENYLSGYEDDGCCSEGIAYWDFGFSHFVIFASMLKDYTDGKINLFDNPKVRKIAMFPYKIRLDDDGNTLSFSDTSGGKYKMPAWLCHTLKANYPDFPILENTPPERQHRPDIRFLFASNPDMVGGKIPAGNYAFEDVQWFIYHGKNYGVGAKAGHNDEFHNHNDVGSFMVSKDNVVSFCDPGVGQYTKEYFAAETRYLDMLCSSRGHSAPIINGEEQAVGNRGICELHSIEGNHFTFDMKNAYDIPTLKSLVRDFDCQDEYFTLTDTYEFSEAPTSLTERFVSFLPVTYEDGVVKSGNSVVEFNPDDFEVSVHSQAVKGTKIRTLYYVDFTVKALDKNMSLTFKFI